MSLPQRLISSFSSKPLLVSYNKHHHASFSSAAIGNVCKRKHARHLRSSVQRDLSYYHYMNNVSSFPCNSTSHNSMQLHMPSRLNQGQSYHETTTTSRMLSSLKYDDRHEKENVSSTASESNDNHDEYDDEITRTKENKSSKAYDDDDDPESLVTHSSTHRRKRKLLRPKNYHHSNDLDEMSSLDRRTPRHDILERILGTRNNNDEELSSRTINEFKNNKSSSMEDAEISAIFPVVSIYAAHQIDIVGVLTKVLNQKLCHANAQPLRHRFGKHKVIVQLPPSPSVSKMSSYKNRRHTPRTKSQRPSAHTSQDTFFQAYGAKSSLSNTNGVFSRYVVVFRFGSIVFFNVGPREQRQIVDQIKNHGTQGNNGCGKLAEEPIPRGFELKEHFGVAICPGMEESDSHVNGDFATIKAFNMNNVAVISTIMAQTVALDSYNEMVDELLGNFAKINFTVKQTGNFTAMERERLFKVVAQNNSIFIDMVSKLGLKDRSDTAWNMSQYETVYEAMKGEFEINGRFKHIQFKLDLIQQNAKFFLEILHNQKTNTLEWIIIWLISLECILMILDMSGMGTQIMNSLPSFPSL